MILMFFGLNLPKRVFLVKERKFEHHHRILHIRVFLGTNFHLKPAIIILWTKFAQKGYFPSKAGQMNIAIKFIIFELF